MVPTSILYLIDILVQGSAGEDLLGVDWYFLPVVNPDGYDFTWTGPEPRLWRKTR